MMPTMAAPVIRSAETKDAEAIARIYNHYVVETIVTFDEVPVTAADIERRIEETGEAGFPWFVAEVDGAAVVGLVGVGVLGQAVVLLAGSEGQSGQDNGAERRRQKRPPNGAHDRSEFLTDPPLL